VTLSGPGLLIDDDELYLRTLQRGLSRHGLETHLACNAAEALRLAESLRPSFALVDLRLGEESGLALIAPLRALRADMRILLVTGYASVATAVDAIKRGADDYLPKPATVPVILRTLGLSEARDVAIEETMIPPASPGMGAYPSGAGRDRRQRLGGRAAAGHASALAAAQAGQAARPRARSVGRRLTPERAAAALQYCKKEVRHFVAPLFRASRAVTKVYTKRLHCYGAFPGRGATSCRA